MSRRPNILLITTDQQRGDCIGVDDSQHPVITPHMDQLAYEGIRFRRAYCDFPLCGPSRSTIMTGRCAYSHQHWSNNGRVPGETSDTLPGRLTARGYQTHAAGKMHFHPARARYGFERMRLLPEDYVNWLETTPYAGMYRGHGLGGNEVYPVFSAVPTPFTGTHWIVEESIDFLRQRDPDHPFFLWTSFEAPHPPFEAPSEYVQLYDRMNIPEPEVGTWTLSEDCPPFVPHRRFTHKLDRLSPELIEAARVHYYAQITFIDYELGRLFGELKTEGVWDDTVVLFASDHGEMLGDHGLFHKQCFYEGAARVPLLLKVPPKWNESLNPGTVVDTPAQVADVCPTLFDLAGCLTEEDRSRMDGISLIDERNLNKPERWIYGFTSADEGLFMATDGRWKYTYAIWHGVEQLFDLQTDPSEHTNIAKSPEHRATVQACRERLAKEVPQIVDPDASDESGFRRSEKPIPSEQVARTRNPYAWRGPLRYGGHW